MDEDNITKVWEERVSEQKLYRKLEKEQHEKETKVWQGTVNALKQTIKNRDKELERYKKVYEISKLIAEGWDAFCICGKAKCPICQLRDMFND